MQVVGVVADAHVLGASRPPGPQAFAPLLGGWGYASVVVVRGEVDPVALAPAIRAAIDELDPGAPPPRITALEELLAEEAAGPWFYAALLSAFAGVGIALAATGIYAVIANGVSRRTHEFGVRLALGATPGDIVRMVMGAGARVVALGACAGLAGAIAATRLLSSLLFGVKPGDPWTLAGALILLTAIALAACWLAARRAASVDLGAALRRE
jgi:putative ABC transport system permease protein